MRRQVQEPARRAPHVRDEVAEGRWADADAVERDGARVDRDTVELYGHLDLSDVARDLALVEKSIHSKGRNDAA